MSVLVTGSAGHLGEALVHSLRDAGREVVGLEIRGSARRVTFVDGTSIDAHTIILATGVTYRRMGAPGMDELTGRGVYYGSALPEAEACAGQDVYVVGGANST